MGSYHVVNLFLSVEGTGVLVACVVASSVVVLREEKEQHKWRACTKSCNKVIDRNYST